MDRPKTSAARLEVHRAECLAWMEDRPAGAFDLAYVDPPFNTGKRQRATRLRTTRDEGGDRVGFGGRRYRTEVLSERSYADHFLDYEAFLAPRLEGLLRLLKPEGSLLVHLDAKEVHYVKVMLDGLVGRENFQNEIVWAYDFGGRSKRRWAAKHDTILWYTKDPERYHFDTEGVDRIPYMAPGLVGEEKARRGKLPTDVWWNTIVSPTGKERLGYPTQKPLAIAERIVEAHCPPGGLCLDVFAGSGTLGAAALARGRRAVLVDRSPEAFEVMERRFEGQEGVFWSRHPEH